jgi:fumarylpyruvate hydrolase
MTYVFPPRPQASAAIHGSRDLFPVNHIHCVGRNYAAHVREMGFDPNREPPFFFQKPADAIVPTGSSIPYPRMSSNVHHEIELVVAIGKASNQEIPVEEALDYVWGYATGVDLTRRDLQLIARDNGRPWEPGKSFDRSAPMAPIVPVSQCGHLDGAKVWLTVNGESRQSTTLNHLIWSVAEVISFLSRGWELFPGDLIFTGTPEGVGPVVKGDKVEGGIEGLPGVEFTVV